MKRRIALVVFGDPFKLPPTLNAARALAVRGWQVDLLGVRWRGKAHLTDTLPPEITTHVEQEIGTGGRHLAGYLAFIARAVRFARRERPDWIYAYDFMAAPVGRLMARVAGARFAYHCHDSARPEEISRSHRWMRVLPRELAAARAADLVVFPQAERARRFAEEARLGVPPAIVFNCPPRDWLDGVRSEDAPTVEHRRRWPRLVLYQGGLNRARGVEALIDSMPGWPGDAGLVLVGDPTTRDVPSLKARAAQLGVAERILWRQVPSYHDLPAIGRSAALGVLITPITDYNLRHLAGASNKVFEYMACGLPVLVPHTAGFDELIEAPSHGEVCRDWSPGALAAQISRLLTDDARRAETGTRNHQAFLARFNYDHQFAEVVRILERER